MQASNDNAHLQFYTVKSFICPYIFRSPSSSTSTCGIFSTSLQHSKPDQITGAENFPAPFLEAYQFPISSIIYPQNEQHHLTPLNASFPHPPHLTKFRIPPQCKPILYLMLLKEAFYGVDRKGLK